ncbi:MAG: hypothetical protein HRT41_02975 [Campylobacteraceae bacterium]|nr:hypothetical protein [Campylobacteraceae bacterium]
MELDLFIGLVGGALISAIIGYFFYKKQKKETEEDNIKQLLAIRKDNEKQLLEIKKDNQRKTILVKTEFESIKKQVSNIDLTNLSENQRNEIISIRSDVSKWVEDLNNDLGKIESRVNKKISKKNEEVGYLSDFLRQFIIDLLDFVNHIIIGIDNSENNCFWKKPKLPANLFNSNIDECITFNNLEILKIEIGQHSIFKDTIECKFTIPKKEDSYNENYLAINFDKINDKIYISLVSSGSLDYIDNARDISEDIINKKMKEVFEHIVISNNKDMIQNYLEYNKS